MTKILSQSIKHLFSMAWMALAIIVFCFMGKPIHYWFGLFLTVIGVVGVYYDAEFTQKKFTYIGCLFIALGCAYTALQGKGVVGWTLLSIGFLICLIRDFISYRWKKAASNN